MTDTKRDWARKKDELVTAVVSLGFPCTNVSDTVTNTLRNVIIP